MCPQADLSGWASCTMWLLIQDKLGALQSCYNNRMNNLEIIDWLLEGDAAIRYQTYRDLLGEDRPDIRTQISSEGWGAQFLKCRNSDGSWGQRFYQPKWISSHYTLLDLKTLYIDPDQPSIQDSICSILSTLKGADGGVLCNPVSRASDVCVNGMFLNYASYFGTSQDQLRSIVDFLLAELMADGGFNCESNNLGARHSSMHSTLSVLEGIQEYAVNGYQYRLDELQQAAVTAREFILLHRFFKSDQTGETIRKDFLRLSFPSRWYYNILRALDYFRAAEVHWDNRMEDAVSVLISKRRRDGRWPLQAAHSGQVHFQMEQPRQPSRWNTLMALRVLKSYPHQFAF